MSRRAGNKDNRARERRLYEDKFNFDGDLKVRGPCPLTGKYRGRVHQSCDLIVKKSTESQPFFSYSFS